MQFGLAQLWEGGWIGALLRGASITIAVGFGAMLLGLVIGIACGLIKWGQVRPLNWLVDIYTTVVRGVPELLIIYLLFFSSVEFVARIGTAFGWAGLADTGYPFLIGVIAIGTISGSYATEVVRGALAGIPKGHIEAARALGMPRKRIFRRIILPQMLRIAVPGLNNIWQATMKDTALMSLPSRPGTVEKPGLQTRSSPRGAANPRATAIAFTAWFTAPAPTARTTALRSS